MLPDNTLLQEFTIRVYGILVDATKGVLVADEHLDGHAFTKFPGGGLQLGEGTRDCLIREWEEELGEKIEVTKHFYTTDFFQRSAFNPSVQVFSIYYLVTVPETSNIIINNRGIKAKDNEVLFRWIACHEFKASMLTLPIDKIVAQLLIDQLLKNL